MKLLYFAWLKTKIGVSEEEVSPPDDVHNVAELISWLKERGPGFADALGNDAIVRVAVNQEFAQRDHPVGAGDEIALFPPVTGG